MQPNQEPRNKRERFKPSAKGLVPRCNWQAFEVTESQKGGPSQKYLFKELPEIVLFVSREQNHRSPEQQTKAIVLHVANFQRRHGEKDARKELGLQRNRQIQHRIASWKHMIQEPYGTGAKHLQWMCSGVWLTPKGPMKSLRDSVRVECQ